MHTRRWAHTAGRGLSLAVSALISLLVAPPLAADDPVDYGSQVQPIFDSTCGGASCHLGQTASGVDLRDHAAVMSSVGELYGGPIVVPGDAASSPLHEKIALDAPRFGERMPRDLPPLERGLIDLVGRWIDEGAREFVVEWLRGDADSSGDLTISDPIRMLGFLFLGDPPPECAPTADANADGEINLSDPVFVLAFLFLGGPAPAPLTREEQASCNRTNRPPEIEPIGTVQGREGVPLAFQVFAWDPDDDAITFSIDVGPAEMSIDSSTGSATWTPAFGEAGDHRIAVRVTDALGASATTTGLVRIGRGNRPPVVPALDTVYGRELVPIDVVLEVTDADGDAVVLEALESPAGSTLDPDTGRFLWTPAGGQAGEHLLRYRAADDGDPPRESMGELRLVIVSRDSPVNQAPAIPARPVYRTHVGLDIRMPIDARDPDGDTLTHAAESLPAGAHLDAATGLFTWTPTHDQVGVFHVPVTASDSGTPPLSASDVLVFRVLPPDPCVDLACDPAVGCTQSPRPLEPACCSGEPDVRVPEPVADCPGGRVLHVGRNVSGFGRLQSCDRLQIEFFAQGGVNVTFHLEARCVNAEDPVLVSARLVDAEHVFFDETLVVQLQRRNDGFAQARSLTFDVEFDAVFWDFEGNDALLSVELVDADGVGLLEEVRVVLTRQDLDDLPDPDVEDVPAGEVGCVGCHRPIGETGARVGIEDAHPWFPLTCTDCHGGDASAITREGAHVPNRFDPAFLRNLASDRLDDVSPDYLRFVNPGDLRVASRGCGAENPASGGSGCHQSIVDSVKLSVMSTYAGHYSLPRFLAGSQDRGAIFAAVDVVDPDFDARSAPRGAVGFLEALRGPDPATPRATIQACMDEYLPKSCPTCHLDDFGRNNAPGNYRSSGCAGCHMVYADDGLSRSRDPVIDRDSPPHPIRHELTTAIPTEQCSHCHFQGGRIGLAYRGIREGGFAPERTPPAGTTLGTPLHAHDRDYYFTDEDATNDVDETPPDVHSTAGMVCADCHVGGDVHGDGNLYVSERYQVGVRCEDCHGTVRAEIAEDPADGLFRSSAGFPLRRLRRSADNRILLRLRSDEREIEVPQIHRILESGVNHAMSEAMGIDENGFSHTDRLECYTCHTSWRQTCFGCHITVDDSGSQRNQTTGEVTPGAISVRRDAYSLDFFALGVNERGRISPLCSSMSISMTYRDSDGGEVFSRRVRTSRDGRHGFGWNPFHHHTVSRVPQNCDRCHPVAAGAGPDNTATLRETYGFGNGAFTFVDGDGVEHDLSAFLGDDGDLIGEFPHPDTGPVPPAVRERAMSVRVTPQPRN